MTALPHDIDVIDAEVVLDASQARALTDRIRQTLTVAHELIIEAFQGRAWTALGYDSWDAYCAGEFGDARMVRLDREQRREIVAEMRQAGMSTPAIASATGIPQSTVYSDLPVLLDRLSPRPAPATHSPSPSAPRRGPTPSRPGGLMTTPNPGSEAAGELGCICAVMDNCHGKFPPIPAGTFDSHPEGAWYITVGCPLHTPVAAA